MHDTPESFTNIRLPEPYNVNQSGICRTVHNGNAAPFG